MRQRVLSTTEKQLFLDFIDGLKKSEIPFVLLRNYEGFPDAIGHDLDIFVPRRRCSEAARVFERLLAAAGGEVIITNRREYFYDIRFYFGGALSSSLILDLFPGSFTWHGLAYLSEEELLGKAGMHEGYPVPRPAHEALNLLFASIIWGGFYKFRYQPQIARLLADQTEREEFDRCITRVFGANTLPPFDPVAPEPPPKKEVLKYAAKVRKGLKRESFKRQPFKTVFNLLRYWAVEIWSAIRPKGLHIAVMGPDGSGKSAVLAGLEQRIGDLFGEIQKYHWRPSVLPDLGVLARSREPQAGPNTEPYAKAPHGFFTGLARLGYYWLDYWMAWPMRLRKARARVHLVLFDRYSHDWVCDPRRYRFRLPKWLLKLAAATTPQPDFAFVLIASEATLAQRKNETPPEIAAGLLAGYRALCQNSKCIEVNADQPLDAVLDSIERHIGQYLKGREHGL